jgi:hypothetical protein
MAPPPQLYFAADMVIIVPFTDKSRVAGGFELTLWIRKTFISNSKLHVQPPYR